MIDSTAAGMAKDALDSVKSLSNYINGFVMAMGLCLTVITALLIYWNNQNDKKHDESKSERDGNKKEVQELTVQITRLTTLLEEMLIPKVKENTDKITEIQLNCADQKHKTKRA